MLFETIKFLSIVVVFMFAIGISTQAMMYHNRPLNSGLLKDSFFPAFFGNPKMVLSDKKLQSN